MVCTYIFHTSTLYQRKLVIKLSCWKMHCWAIYHQRIQEDQATHDLPPLLGLPVVQKHLERLDHLLHLKDIPSSTKDMLM